MFNTAPGSQDDLLLQPELLKHQQHGMGNRFLAGGKFSKWRLGKPSDNHISDVNEVRNRFPKESKGKIYLLKRVEAGGNEARERKLYTRLRRRDELNQYGRMVIRGEKRGEGGNQYMRREVKNPYKRAMKVIGGTLEMREEELEEDVKHVRVMKGLDDKTLYPRPLTRVMKRGREKYTRVMKKEHRDDFDARLVKRGEEEDTYVLVMRKAKDTIGIIPTQGQP